MNSAIALANNPDDEGARQLVQTIAARLIEKHEDTPKALIDSMFKRQEKSLRADKADFHSQIADIYPFITERYYVRRSDDELIKDFVKSAGGEKVAKRLLVGTKGADNRRVPLKPLRRVEVQAILDEFERRKIRKSKVRFKLGRK
jgi:hypothetical protein